MTSPDRRWPPGVYGVGDEPDPRFTLANERTFLAWIRTGLGFLAAGIALVAFARVSSLLRLEVRIASVGLILAGVVCASTAFVRWARVEAAIRRGGPLPSSPAMPLISVLLVVVAGIAAVLVSLL